MRIHKLTMTTLAPLKLRRIAYKTKGKYFHVRWRAKCQISALFKVSYFLLGGAGVVAYMNDMHDW